MIVSLAADGDGFGCSRIESYRQGGLATAFDLAAFRLSMIAPVKVK